MSPHVADDADVDQGVFVNGGVQKGTPYPEADSPGHGTPSDSPVPGSAGALDDSALRRRAVGEQGGVGGAGG